MRRMLIPALVLFPLLVHAEQWQSSNTQTDVIELFTSEGCSSCPPADAFLSSLKNRDGVFRTFIPMAFHVDYWNYIGWKDRFASSEYSQRQRRYARDGNISQVYTPGFVINSQEWRPWFRGARNWETSNEQGGNLTADLQGNRLKVYFADKTRNHLHVAYLGMGIETQVKAGENRGKTLTHDFVVLDVTTLPGEGEWQLKLPAAPDKGQQRTALAIWVSPTDSQQVLQAVGGYLE